jgi:MerR family transcriptional regulator, light-induced transcriptional regulator
MNMVEPHYPIRAVARMTGLSVDTLRAWERRYEAVVPGRGQRGRVYTDRHVDRLKLLSGLVAAGHAIGSIAALPDAALRKLRSGDSLTPAGPPRDQVDGTPLVRAVQAYDLRAIELRLHRLAVLMPTPDLIFEVILPLLRDVGARWEAGQVTPAQEHLVSGVVRNVLGALLRVMPRPARGAPLVFATPAGERHELGLLCGALLAASAGHTVAYLGPDLPAGEIARAARRTEAQTLVLAGTASGVDYAELRTLRRLPASMAIWAGGARAAELRQTIGPRARRLASLEELRGLLDRHAA